MLLEINRLDRPLAFSKVFGRDAPLEIEIGVGKGRYLKEIAIAFPETNFLGIEKSLKWLTHAKTRLEKAEIHNVALIRTYAEGFLDEYIPAISIRKFHIMFPDPWPKKRHHKRRIFSQRFLETIYRKLEPHGLIQIATDHQEYYRAIVDLFCSAEVQCLYQFEESRPSEFQTNFQVKYLKEGRELFFATAKKRPADQAPALAGAASS